MAIASDIGIDLGTSTLLIYMQNKGIVLNEPSVAAIDTYTGKLLCAGEEARQMLGKTSDRVTAAYPLIDGVISAYGMAEKMLTHFIKKVCNNKVFMPRVVVCVPSIITGVERRAVIDAIYSAGARKVIPIEEPVAAAIGAGIDITRPHGSMVVDVGGGTTDIAVLSLNGISVSTSIKIAGNEFDADIIRFMKTKYNVLIGEKTAERLKNEIGNIVPDGEILTADAKGRNMVTGLPASVTLTSRELSECFTDSAVAIANAVQEVLEQTPPELVADIFEDGIVMTGGGALMRGLDRLISAKTKIKAHVAPDPQQCVVLGTGKVLSSISELEGEENLKYRDVNN